MYHLLTKARRKERRGKPARKQTRPLQHYPQVPALLGPRGSGRLAHGKMGPGKPPLPSDAYPHFICLQGHGRAIALLHLPVLGSSPQTVGKPCTSGQVGSRVTSWQLTDMGTSGFPPGGTLVTDVKTPKRRPSACGLPFCRSQRETPGRGGHRFQHLNQGASQCGARP